MSTARVFLLSPSLARLIEKEREGRHVRQGYFPDRPDRGTHVQLEQETGRLILVSNPPNGPVEEATDIPRSQAEALLELAAGQVEYLEVSLDIGSQTAILRRILTLGSLDLLTVTLEHGKRAPKFQPLAWFGPEVTGDAAYQGRTIALNGVSSVPEVEITDAALNSLLDALEGRFGAYQPQAAAPQPIAPSKPAEAEADNEDDHDDLEIEDSVIRELARSLNPRQR
jgi:CYTH domain-containing protein